VQIETKTLVVLPEATPDMEKLMHKLARKWLDDLSNQTWGMPEQRHCFDCGCRGVVHTCNSIT